MTIKWGVVSPGGISRRFADAMTMVDDGRIVAVSSRSQERANAYGDRYDVARRYCENDDMAADRNVDAVYIGSPHHCHAADAIRFLEAGKHVLCEKPMALNAVQVQQMIDAAQANNVFLMEAMWSRFLPAYQILGELLAEGRIGEPTFVEADFGFRSAVGPQHRLFNHELGGGALLDLGIYPLQLCSLVLGAPDRIVADGQIGETGVDEHTVVVLHHPGGAMGVAKASLRADLRCSARISGSEGVIELPPFMHCPDWVTVTSGGRTDRIEAGFEGDGLRFEIAAVNRCIAGGLVECPVWPLSESLAIARTMDTARAAMGLAYPGEDVDPSRA